MSGSGPANEFTADERKITNINHSSASRSRDSYRYLSILLSNTKEDNRVRNERDTKEDNSNTKEDTDKPLCTSYNSWTNIALT